MKSQDHEKIKNKMNAKKNVLSQTWKCHESHENAMFPVFFWSYLKKIRTKLIQEENILSQPWHWKAIKDFFHFFPEASWKVKIKINVRRKCCITAWALKKPLKVSSSFQFFLKLHEKSRTKSMQDFLQFLVLLTLHEK